MAMTDEELLLQMNILATKTDSKTNPNMVYKTNATLNKGLNPDYFSGNYTKIVNALNQLAGSAETSKVTATNVLEKVNSVLLDVDSTDGGAIWRQVQELMDKPTIIEGIQNILEGNRQEQILGLTADDVGKILSVQQNENGNLVVKAIDAVIEGGGSMPSEIDAAKVMYSNESFSRFTNISEAMDFVLANLDNSGETSSDIFWDAIINKPEVANNLVLTGDSLSLQSEQGIMASVGIVSDLDIDNIINNLN